MDDEQFGDELLEELCCVVMPGTLRSPLAYVPLSDVARLLYKIRRRNDRIEYLEREVAYLRAERDR